MPRPSRVLVLSSPLLVLVILALVPVPEPRAGNVHSTTGRVTAVGSPCCGDVEIRLAGDVRRYHLNRALESGSDLEGLRSRLVDRTVEIEIVDRTWTPLDPLHRMAVVARITTDGNVVFDRLD